VLDLVRTTIRLAPPACRFLLTARPYAWPDAADARQGVYQLAELTEPQIEQFITRWYAAMQRHRWCPPDDADAKRDDLLQAYQRDELLPLARNPLLLTQMAMLHSNRGRLPEDRAELYHESVELLLQRWTGRIDADRALLDELKVPGLRMSDLRTALEELAYLVHAANAGNSGTADIGEDLMRRHFRPLLGGSLDKAQRVLDYIDQRAGLLIGQDPRAGERQFSFPHRSFQEFLAACHLAARGDFESACVELARQAPGHWQVVLPLAARRAGRDRGASAADALVHGRPVDDFRRGTRPEPADWTGALLAGWQLLEIGPGVLRASERGTAIADRVAGWLAAALPLHPVHDGGAPARQRVQAASVLARLGDPRFDPARLHLPADPMLGFVRVSADPAYCIGTRRADAQRVRKIIGGEVPERELNDDAVACPEFLIGRHLVTTAQFQAYVQATGRQPGDPGALRGAPHEPVRRVSWHEALDYCRWLGERLAAGVELADRPPAGLLRRPGLRTTLPSELEWERAARAGRPGAVFPWGDDNDPDMANTAEAELGAVSPVGCFLPNGFGLHDMVGNVWEWTRSLWGDDDSKPTFGYPYLPDDPARENPDAGDKTYRVVRGGAFSDHRDGARCACRLRNHPGCRDDRLGFRVVLREAPVFEPPGAGRSGL
jgi:formylglycine-generating enzyme required for sulfatase activity